MLCNKVLAVEDLLPDIIVNQSDLFDTDITDTIIPGRTHLRLSNGTANIGLGQLYLRGVTPSGGDSQEVLQRIFRDDGSWWERTAGIFRYHQEHGHIHFEDWAHYRIREILPEGGIGAVLAQSEKVSFCIIDLDLYDSTLTNFSGAHFLGCGDSIQGLSVGYIDTYVKELAGQTIDITGLPNGTYWLESEVDPVDGVLESNEENNIARIQMDICIAGFTSPIDSIWMTDAAGPASSLVRVDIEANNSLPVREIQITFTWSGPLNLSFQSISTAGLRTEYFENIILLGKDDANKLRSYLLVTSATLFSQPDLAPGEGPILSIYFRIPFGAPDTSNAISFVTNPVLQPTFTTGCGSYAPVVVNSGLVTLSCCSNRTGNVNGDNLDHVDVLDLVALIDYLYITFEPLDCSLEANINGDASGIVDIRDLTTLINHLFVTFESTANCR